MKKETPETRIKRQIVSLFKNLNIWNFPILQGLGCYPGIPDRFAVYKGAVYAIEIKAPDGRQSNAQEKFQKAWDFYTTPEHKAIAELAEVFAKELPQQTRGSVIAFGQWLNKMNVRRSKYILARSVDDVIDGMGLRDRFLI